MKYRAIHISNLIKQERTRLYKLENFDVLKFSLKEQTSALGPRQLLQSLWGLFPGPCAEFFFSRLSFNISTLGLLNALKASLSFSAHQLISILALPWRQARSTVTALIYKLILRKIFIEFLYR